MVWPPLTSTAGSAYAGKRLPISRSPHAEDHRHHHERRLGPDGLPPAPGAFDPGDPGAGRGAAGERRAGAGRAAAGRPQRGEARRARRAARHRRLHHRSRRRARRPALGHLRRLPRDEGPRRGDPQGHRGGQGDLHREADRGEPGRGARAGRARPGRGHQERRGARQAVPAGPAQARPARGVRLLRPDPVDPRRVRLLGLRRRLAARAAAELELPHRGRRRHRRRHVPALELRVGEPLRAGQVGLCPGGHAHPVPRRRVRKALLRHRGRRRLRGLRARRGSHRAAQLELDGPRRPQGARRVPGGRHARQRGRRAAPMPDPAPRRHPQAGLEPRPRRDPRLRERLDGRPRQRRLRERLQDPVGAVHPACRGGRAARVRLPRGRSRRPARRGRPDELADGARVDLSELTLPEPAPGAAISEQPVTALPEPAPGAAISEQPVTALPEPTPVDAR